MNNITDRCRSIDQSVLPQCKSRDRQNQPILDSTLYKAVTFEPIVRLEKKEKKHLVILSLIGDLLSPIGYFLRDWELGLI